MAEGERAIVGAHLAIAGGLPFRVIELQSGSNIVGRGSEADIPLDRLEVSRRHCDFSWDGERCHVQDLNSHWGTRVNGVRITGRPLLSPGDKIAIGPIVLVFGIGPAPREEDVPRENEAAERVVPPMLFHGEPANKVPLGEPLIIGRGQDADVLLSDPGVSRQHARVERVATGFKIVDLRSTGGTFVNGQRFDEHELAIGDRLQVGPYAFQFDGSALVQITGAAGGNVRATGLSLQAGERTIISDVTIAIEGGRFAGILGPSGAGKSSLLTMLAGMRVPRAGRVEVNGRDIYTAPEANAFGYVPQEDIVHEELTVSDALRFSAELRLPCDTPPLEVQKLILQTLDRLGLRSRAGTQIARLSGGQRKRVSVAVELLARPEILFLDEPSSGLDPATEFKLMELLRDLADTGTTIICTTHVMENAYLMDQLAVLYGGSLVFYGSPQETREYFRVPRLSGLYDRLEERPVQEWAADWAPALPPPEEPPPIEPVTVAPPRGRGAGAALATLLRRQWAILASDWRNFAILGVQPLVIAALVAWVSNDDSLLLFFAYVAALWFGCSNAAQEIVKEIPIYRRERTIGLNRHAYLTGKWVMLTGVTAAQGLLLYLTMQLIERGIAGAAGWQITALVGASAAAVAIGLAISAVARTVMQSVLIVPLLLIPLILFSGYTVPAHEMKPHVAAVSQATPTFAAQTLMDVSFLWRQRIARETLSDHWTSFRNLNRGNRLRTGETYIHWGPIFGAVFVHLCWTIGGYFIALISLARRERT
jgi:ABC-type multidrug transport system ATPase subunit/pSer/pThr/pTyr-binding forkhead associated (FHA) protein